MPQVAMRSAPASACRARPLPPPIDPRLRAAALLWIIVLAAVGTAVALNVDPIAGAAILLAAIAGWRGFQRSAVRAGCALAAALGVYAWAIPVGRRLAPMLHFLGDIALVPSRYLGVAVAALGMLLAGEAAGRLLQRWQQQRHGPGSRRSCLTGLCLGMGEGAVYALTVALILVSLAPAARLILEAYAQERTWGPTAHRAAAALERTAQQSALGRLLSRPHQHRNQVLQVGAALAAAARRPQAVTRLRQDPALNMVLDSDADLRRVQLEVAGDVDLQRAVREGDIDAILDCPTVVRLLEDTALAKAVERHRFVLLDAIARAVDEPGSAPSTMGAAMPWREPRLEGRSAASSSASQ